MSELDIQKVRKAFFSDLDLSAQEAAEEAEPSFGPLIEALPSLLKEHLDKPVTVPSLMTVKLILLEHMLETRFFYKMYKASPNQEPAGLAEAAAEMAEEALEYERMPLMEMMHNTQAFLEQEGHINERALLASQVWGRLNPASLTAYDLGTLTIRSLLETQPVAVLSIGATEP